MNTSRLAGLLYSFISLKDLPDATFPGVLRELVVMDFPIIINAEVVLPDQTKAVKQYKARLRKMTAAQKDIHGGFRLNVDAQVAEHQLVKVLQELISSSLKSCQLSLTVPSAPHGRPAIASKPKKLSALSPTAGSGCCTPSGA